MRLQDRSVIVTGGASGIGKAIALRLAAEGARIVVADLTEQPREGGAQTVAAIRQAGGTAQFVTADVSSWADVDRLVSTARNRAFSGSGWTGSKGRPRSPAWQTMRMKARPTASPMPRSSVRP